MTSDDRVFDDLMIAFRKFPGLEPSRISILVKSHIVTIRGYVNDPERRRDVERIARDIIGARALILEMGVQRQPKVYAIEG